MLRDGNLPVQLTNPHYILFLSFHPLSSLRARYSSSRSVWTKRLPKAPAFWLKKWKGCPWGLIGKYWDHVEREKLGEMIPKSCFWIPGLSCELCIHGNNRLMPKSYTDYLTIQVETDSNSIAKTLKIELLEPCP